MEGHRFCLAKQKRRYHRHNYSVEVGILFYFRAVLNFEEQRLGKIISDETAICLKIFTRLPQLHQAVLFFVVRRIHFFIAQLVHLVANELPNFDKKKIHKKGAAKLCAFCTPSGSFFKCTFQNLLFLTATYRIENTGRSWKIGKHKDNTDRKPAGF